MFYPLCIPDIIILVNRNKTIFDNKITRSERGGGEEPGPIKTEM